MLRLLAAAAIASVCLAQPPLPHKLVPGWAKLPKGWNFGECSGIAIDKDDSVWIAHRGQHPIVQLDKNGNLIQAWGDGLFKSAHGITLDADGNPWIVDVEGHVVFKFSRDGKVLLVLGARQGVAGNNDSKEEFNRPTRVAFAPNGDFFVSDGYLNSRVVKYNRDLEYQKHWGRKGAGDGEFDLVHDVVLDKRNRVYVADRTNARVQIFDMEGKFLGKWTQAGSPYGLAYVEKEDAMYICDGLNGRIVKVNMEGQVLGALGSPGRIPGRLTSAHHIAVDSRGDIYVSEIRNWRVQKFAKP
jgi:DNA-binding beta-propeller fold protein YncE